MSSGQTSFRKELVWGGLAAPRKRWVNVRKACSEPRWSVWVTVPPGSCNRADALSSLTNLQASVGTYAVYDVPYPEVPII